MDPAGVVQGEGGCQGELEKGLRLCIRKWRRATVERELEKGAGGRDYPGGRGGRGCHRIYGIICEENGQRNVP